MNNRLTICLSIAILVALLTPISTVQCQDYYAYSVQVRSDNAAVWTITQFSDINAATTSWGYYQQRIYGLVNEAANVTGRSMSVDGGSLEINTTLSAESKVTEYTFVWFNFSYSQGDQLVFGDVFSVNNFFGKLFGDASIQMTYPQGYTVKSVYPQPYQRQDDQYVLKWARTQDLAVSNVNVVLAPSGQSTSGGSSGAQSSFIGLAVVGVVVPVGLAGFFVFRKRQKGSGNQLAMEIAVPSALESDEDKILKLLKASGGSMRQTEITERLGYSKAKTSQLLTAMEAGGVLARYKKGRDKIVTFRKGED